MVRAFCRAAEAARCLGVCFFSVPFALSISFQVVFAGVPSFALDRVVRQLGFRSPSSSSSSSSFSLSFSSSSFEVLLVLVFLDARSPLAAASASSLARSAAKAASAAERLCSAVRRMRFASMLWVAR